MFFKAGYTRHRVTEVQILSEQIVKQDLVMAQDYADLEELDDFVITASDAMDIAIELLKERQKESSFVDSIGKEMFSKIGAGDAASALTKVTGVTIQGGKYAVVRGLGGRYSNTTLNGVLLPSPDPDKKAVHMDLFPTGLLESIVTANTFTPDMPGDFSGGSVNLR
ncbi:MAG: TonB-dependent receptor plug domain-containing protein, partial [Opitutae bacterium]